MKVWICLDLTNKVEADMFQHIRATLHAQELPEPTKTALAQTLGAGVKTHPDVSVKEVREVALRASNVNQDAVFKYLAELQSTYGVKRLEDLNGSQLATVLHDLKKMEGAGDLPSG